MLSQLSSKGVDVNGACFGRDVAIGKLSDFFQS